MSEKSGGGGGGVEKMGEKKERGKVSVRGNEVKA